MPSLVTVIPVVEIHVQNLGSVFGDEVRNHGSLYLRACMFSVQWEADTVPQDRVKIRESSQSVVPVITLALHLLFH